MQARISTNEIKKDCNLNEDFRSRVELDNYWFVCVPPPYFNYKITCKSSCVNFLYTHIICTYMCIQNMCVNYYIEFSAE